MRFVAILIVLAFIEVAMTVLFAKWLGPVLTFLLFAIPTATGLHIQWRRKPAMLTAWNQFRSRPTAEDWDEKQRIRLQPDAIRAETEFYLYWITVFLLLVPGPLTASIAFLLLLPPTRRFVHFLQQDSAKTVLSGLPAATDIVIERPRLPAPNAPRRRSSNAKRKRKYR